MRDLFEIDLQLFAEETKVVDDVVVEDDAIGADGTEGEGVTDEEVTYKKDQVEKIVSTRVNTLNKRNEKLIQYKAAVDNICEITGLDFDTLTKKLTGMSPQEQAAVLGVTVEQAQAAQHTRKLEKTVLTENQRLTRQIEEKDLRADKRYSDYDIFKEEINDFLEENPKLSLKQAYLLVKGDVALEAAARDAEQAAIARQVNASNKGIVKPGGTTGPTTKLSAGVVSAAKAVGMDPVEYANYSKVDNLDAYRAMKKK